MHPKALLEAATALVQRVLAFEHPLDRVVVEFTRGGRAYGPRERHALADTAYDVVRRLGFLTHLAQLDGWPASAAPERRLAILGWQGDAAFLAAALDPAEADARRAALAVDRAALPERLRHDLPEWIVERLRPALGDDVMAWAAGIDRPAPLDLRANLVKGSRDEAIEALHAEAIDAVPTPHSPIGLRVAGKPSLLNSRVAVEGRVEVQDEGSQILALLVGARRGETIVDYCAGAGGKTLAIGAQMRGTGRLYAFDTSAHRLAALAPRLARSGLGHVVTMQVSGEADERVRRLHGKVDRVLVDAPCTGLGTLRRHPDLKWRQTPTTLAELVVQQAAIVDAAAHLVKPGGWLFYATCSPLADEDEAIAAGFDRRHGEAFERRAVVPLLERARVGAAATLAAGDDLRLWTHRHGCDSFYAAAWQKKGAGKR